MSLTTSRARLAMFVALATLAPAFGSCASDDAGDDGYAIEAYLSAAVRRARATAIRDAARARGITDGALMVAMLAEEETGMAHCASEFRACPGPVSPDCGGAAVLSGGGDGPCSLNQGGLGMFQIDDGTEANTVAVHGARVLTMAGNTDVAIDRILEKLIRSSYLGISNTTEAIAFLNALRIDDANYDPYIRTIIRYWNGCREGAACWANRYTKYNAAPRTLLREMGTEFWYGTTTPPPAGSGWLASPIAAPRITSNVSHARSGGGWENHDCATLTRANHRGTDFGVPVGTPVSAAAAGTVIRSVTGCPANGSMSETCGGSFGNHVIVLHAGGNATLYAHFRPDGTQIRNGARVECGTLLGHSGNSGRSSGPHLHFEVRRNVTSEATYFVSNNTLDPYGGRCSSQMNPLWIGGTPTASCMPSTRDDAVVVRATYPREVAGTAGQMLRQEFVWRNRGTTTWNSTDFVMRHESGAFGEAAMVALPSGMTVAPGAEVTLTVNVTVPAGSGVHRGAWRIARRTGAAFGSEGTLTVRVPAAPRACNSSTLGRSVESGSCVQVNYPGCGESRCARYRCADGTWQCADETTCTGESFDNAACAPMEPDAGVPPDSAARCEDLACTECVITSGCEYCPGASVCLSGVNRGMCSGGTTTAPGVCGVCSEVRGVCSDRLECCGAATNANIECMEAYCEDTSACIANGATCDPASTEPHCCGPQICGLDTSRASECCGIPGQACTTQADCCGYEECTGGVCQVRAIGQSCMNTQECEGASYCLDTNVCGF